MIYVVCEYLATILDAVALVYIPDRLFEPKFKFRIIHMLIGIIGGVAIMELFKNNAVIQGGLFLLYYVVYGLICYKDKVWKIIVSGLVFFMALSCVNGLVIQLVSVITDNPIPMLVTPGTYTRILVLALTKIFLWIIIFSSTNILKRKFMTIYDTVLCVVIFGMSLILSFFFVEISVNMATDNEVLHELLFMEIVVVILNITSLIIIHKNQKLYEEKLSEQEMNLRIDEEQKLLDRLGVTYEEIRMLRHDSKHYYLMILSKLENGSAEECKKYINDILDKQELSKHEVFINNNVINYIVNEKKTICIKNNIVFDVNVIGSIQEKDSNNVGVIISNLLDNAIEASIMEEYKHIVMDLEVQRGLYNISVKNKISQSVLSNNPKLISRKTNLNIHGLGLNSVKYMANKMNGAVSITEENGYFKVQVQLEE